MIISIASGKGGTGKTTVAVNLALSFESMETGNAQLLDCDVEEPNCHLFLNTGIEKTETVYTPVPEIDKDKCSFCHKCVDICRFNVIALAGKTVLTFPELCHSCGGCMAVCPEDAITEVGREIGVTKQTRVKNLDFVYGCLRVGEAMSPPLIQKVRSFIQPDKINIIDAPPGTSCPVIAAMNNTDFVLLVTEPTPFGLHDLKLAVEAVKILGIPHGLVINRSDMGDTKVQEYAKQENIPILLKIPFDRRIAQAYSKGIPIVEQMPEWKEKFLNLYSDIKKITDKGAEKR